MVQVSAAITTSTNLWRPIFNTHLANIRAGRGIGENQAAAREIVETIPGFNENEIVIAEKDCEPIQAFNKLCLKIGYGEIDLIDEARKLQEQYVIGEAVLTDSIFHGVNERLLTLSMYIGAGNLSYVAEAHQLIEEHGDTRRFPGEKTRKELLADATVRGIEQANIKADIAARDAEIVSRKALLDIGAGI